MKKQFSKSQIFVILFSSIYLLIVNFNLISTVDLPLNNKFLEKIKKTKVKDNFSFIVLGDNRDGDEIFKTILQKVKELKPKPLLIINTGDMVHSGRKTQYESLINILKTININMIGVPGNHDYELGNSTNFKTYFGKNEFTFDIGNYRFLLLDNAGGILTKEQLSFAEKSLTTKKMKFVFLHMPPAYSFWKFHSFSNGAKEFMNLMEEKKVSRVFMGHIHAFDYRKIKSVTYVLAGGGGAPLYKMPGLNPINHFVIVNVSKGEVKEKVIKVEVGK